jgi:hypothetical protein
VPDTLKSTVFAECVLTGVATTTAQAGTIEFAQQSGHPIYARTTDLANFTADAVISGFIYEYGTLGTSCDIANAGNEFNPLREVKNDVPNPYQDPARGRLSTITANSTGANVTWTQSNLMQNLASEHGIIGRQIAFYEAYDPTPMATNTVAACCTIVRSVPATVTPTAVSPWSKSVHSTYHAADPTHPAHSHVYSPPKYGHGASHGHGHGHGQGHQGFNFGNGHW